MYLKYSDHVSYHSLTLSRPQRMNALGTQIAQELKFELQKISQIPNLRPLLLVVTSIPSKGQKIGIAGGDLKELADLNREQAIEYCNDMSWCCDFLSRAAHPTIISCDGKLIGGGAELALACDVRLGTVNTDFIFKQLHIGLATGYGSAERMVRLIGLARSQKLLYSEPVLTAEEAFSLGLLHHIYPDTKTLEAAIPGMIEGYLKYGPEAWAAQKKMFNLSTWDGQLNEETKEFAKIWRNPTHDNFLKRFFGRN